MNSKTNQLPAACKSLQKHLRLTHKYLLENNTKLATEEIQQARFLLEKIQKSTD